MELQLNTLEEMKNVVKKANSTTRQFIQLKIAFKHIEDNVF
jgi:hypothetical protein